MWMVLGREVLPSNLSQLCIPLPVAKFTSLVPLVSYNTWQAKETLSFVPLSSSGVATHGHTQHVSM